MISLEKISLQRGPQMLLENTSLVVHPRQRVGVIGANGCGKTSFFKLLLGELAVDSGELKIPPDWCIAHMAQEVATIDRSAVDYVMDGDRFLREIEQGIAAAEASGDNNKLADLYEKMDNMGGFDAHYRAEQFLHGLGFTQQETTLPANSFSGGWRIRLNLAQALMCPSDLLLLDEPTNHLDLDATFWLEQWLKSYQGTLILISHDRDFIDNVVDIIVHIEHQQCWAYKGNYSAFERSRAERLSQQQATYEKQQQRRKEIEGFVNRFRAKASKAKQAQSRLKELQRMEDIAPAHADSPFHFSFPEGRHCSSALVNLQQADLGYDPKVPILQQVDLDLLPGSRVGLLGPNGAGKSTLIKTLMGNLPLLSGDRVCNEHLNMGYFAQHQLEALDVQASALRHIQNISPEASEKKIRSFLGGFNFRGDKALEVIKDFSGGEKARLALALVVWQKPNLLLLDEPTNHLDLEMRHALTEAIQGYEGALVVISHDRHLLRNTVDEFHLVANGSVQSFDGDLDDYQKWLRDYSKLDRAKIDRNKTDSTTTDGKANTDKVSVKAVATADVDKVSVDKVDKKVLRKHSAEKRKQLEPLRKKVLSFERKIEKDQRLLTDLETKLADEHLYDDDKKDELKTLLFDQAVCQQRLTENEEQWLLLHDELEDQLEANHTH